jgi:ubiquinone/menaquinone biosynthesis C-methylase UbiE
MGSTAPSTYDRLARWYDLLSLPERPLKRRALELLAPQEGERVLVVGSGTGQELAWIARAGALALGVDVAPAMCRRALARLARAQLLGLAAPLCADGRHLPVARGSFHAALLVFTLELFAPQEMPLVLSEVASALAPGGRLAVASLSRRRTTALTRLYEWAHTRWPRAIDCRPILAAPLLAAQGWHTSRLEDASLCGLPVDLVLAHRPERASQAG